MEYSTDDIAAARSSQFTTWTFLLQSHWSKMKGLYIVTRYTPFIILAMDLYMSFTPNENTGVCAAVHSQRERTTYCVTSPEMSGVAKYQSRSWLCNSNALRIHAVDLIDATSPIPGIPGCYQSSTSFWYFIPFLLLSVFELGGTGGQTQAVLFSVANIFTSLLLEPSMVAYMEKEEFMTKLRQGIFQRTIALVNIYIYMPLAMQQVLYALQLGLYTPTGTRNSQHLSNVSNNGDQATHARLPILLIDITEAMHPNPRLTVSMEYSTDDIAAARSLQFTKYMHTSMATIWIYGYACSLDEEWAFLLRSHWTKMKGLYIVARFLPLIFCATSLYMDLTPSNDSVDACRMLVNVESGLFILRTYVLWNKNRTLLAAILCSFFVRLARSQESQGATRARPVTNSSYHFFSFLHFNWDWRTNTSHLFQVEILAILATHMHLHLWQLIQCCSWGEAWTIQDDWREWAR
ncbi:hypothetical protein C8R48DRAFT_679760 [Suillus tomentosus]|nr:hypothetical protein C8R48DRAFT_679760 [Suillus tomentosus]